MSTTRQPDITPSLEHELLETARGARENAWAPYSKFKVGAAVLTSEGDAIVSGSNVENASYGLTICAERSAIFAAVAQGHQSIKALAVAVDQSCTGTDEERMPCGACRQVMAEFMQPNSIILVDGVGRFELSDLLPHAFAFKKSKNL